MQSKKERLWWSNWRRLIRLAMKTGAEVELSREAWEGTAVAKILKVNKKNWYGLVKILSSNCDLYRSDREEWLFLGRVRKIRLS